MTQCYRGLLTMQFSFWSCGETRKSLRKGLSFLKSPSSGFLLITSSMAKLQVDEIPLLHYTADIEAARDGVDNA